MLKTIVTTTINPPTEAIKRFVEIARRDDWRIIIVGDLKTPHHEYEELEKGNPFLFYFHPHEQAAKYKELSDLIGWNCIQRRNLGVLLAYHQYSHITAVIDDDNIPDEYWGRGLCIGGDNKALDIWETEQEVFDPISPFGHDWWHRGFPIELIPKKNDVVEGPKFRRRWLVQADLWNGDPDVDAIGRIALKPDVKFTHDKPYAGNKIAPFNSQNTFLMREVIPDYFLFPHIGRMDDIWAAYHVQARHGLCVAFGRASVYQDRNPHNLGKDLEAELIGYRHSLEFVKALEDYKSGKWLEFLPEKTQKAFEVWQKECAND